MSAAVNLDAVFARLETGLMSMLTGGEEAQTLHLVAVERLCALARTSLAGDNLAESALSGIAERAPLIAGLMMVPDGLREVALSECIRLLAQLRDRLAAQRRVREVA